MSDERFRQHQAREAAGLGYEPMIFDRLKQLYPEQAVVWRSDPSKIVVPKDTDTNKEWYYSKARVDFVMCNNILTHSIHELYDMKLSPYVKQEIDKAFKYLMSKPKIAVEVKDSSMRAKGFCNFSKILELSYEKYVQDEYISKPTTPQIVKDQPAFFYGFSNINSYEDGNINVSAAFAEIKIDGDSGFATLYKKNCRCFGVLKYLDGEYAFEYTPEIFEHLQKGYLPGLAETQDNYSYFIPCEYWAKWDGIVKLETLFDSGKPVKSIYESLSESSRKSIDDKVESYYNKYLTTQIPHMTKIFSDYKPKK